MGVIQTSKRVPRNVSENKRVPDAQAVAGPDAFNTNPPQDMEFGNLGPNASIAAPSGNSESNAGANSGFAAVQGATSQDTYINNKSRATMPKKGNPHPGGGW